MMIGRASLDIKERLLIESDSCIIDLLMRYDYCKTRENEFSHSNKRNFRFPQIKAENPKSISDLKNVLNLVFANPKVTAYLHFVELSNRKFTFKPYFELNISNFADLRIGNSQVEFKESDSSNFNIEFKEINQTNNKVNIDFEIKEEGVTFTMQYELINEEWKLVYERQHEK